MLGYLVAITDPTLAETLPHGLADVTFSKRYVGKMIGIICLV